MRYLLALLFIFILANVCACNDGQIDINSASKEDLDNLYGIGPVKAEAIIDSRPFESVDDLLDVNGIGEITLQKIKEQGLVCVDEKEEEPEEVKKEIIEEQEETKEEKVEFIEKAKPQTKNTELEVIKLNPQIIKSEDDEDLEEVLSNYAIYGFVVFCVLLGVLFVMRKNRFNKNEFR